MGTNENSYGHALIQKLATPSYENSVPRTHTPPKKIGFAPLPAVLIGLQKRRYVKSMVKLKSIFRDQKSHGSTAVNRRKVSSNYASLRKAY